VRHRGANPAGYLGECEAKILAAFGRFAVLLCIQKELRLADHAFRTTEAVEHFEEAGDLLRRVGRPALLAVTEGRVGYPDVPWRVQGHRLTFELHERRQDVGERVAVVVRAFG